MCLFIEHSSCVIYPEGLSNSAKKKKKKDGLLAFSFFLLVHGIGLLQNHAVVISFSFF